MEDQLLVKYLAEEKQINKWHYGICFTIGKDRESNRPPRI
jgi:hypothetical protein